MSDIVQDEQKFSSTPAAGVGAWYFDHMLSLPFYVDAAGRKWGHAHRTITVSQTGFVADTYVTNAGILIPSFGLQAKTILEWILSVSKTAAGTATPVYRVRIGTTQTTTDTGVLTLTGPAQTAAADVGILTILLTVRSVGAAGVLQGHSSWSHNGAATGFANNDAGAVQATSSGFDNSNLAGLFIGLSITGGASAAWTVTQVRTQAIW
jgi:hypothetical protein